jgi:7-carboxy-7-deazaguanine synthase
MDVTAPGTRPSDSGTAEKRLKVTEIFTSLQGEAAHVGWPTVFVRLTGCPLRCVWCDTAYAFTGGQWMTRSDVIDEVRSANVRHVCVTGGEPLAQRACLGLLESLCEEGFIVSLETSGALDVSSVDPRVHKVVDVKTPGSGEHGRNLDSNFACLGSQDSVKYVIADRQDFDWARDHVRRHGLASCCEVLFSPVWDSLPPAQLGDWILAEKLPVRFQLQVHKVLWGDEPGR